MEGIKGRGGRATRGGMGMGERAKVEVDPWAVWLKSVWSSPFHHRANRCVPGQDTTERRTEANRVTGGSFLEMRWRYAQAYNGPRGNRTWEGKEMPREAETQAVEKPGEQGHDRYGKSRETRRTQREKRWRSVQRKQRDRSSGRSERRWTEMGTDGDGRGHCELGPSATGKGPPRSPGEH